MTAKDARQDWAEIMADAPDSVAHALDKIGGKIKWLEFVADGEFAPKDRDRIITAAREFFAVITPMAARYVDGEE